MLEPADSDRKVLETAGEPPPEMPFAPFLFAQRVAELVPGSGDVGLESRVTGRQATTVAAIEFTLDVQSVLREASRLPTFLTRFSR